MWSGAHFARSRGSITALSPQCSLPRIKGWFFDPEGFKDGLKFMFLPEFEDIETMSSNRVQCSSLIAREVIRSLSLNNQYVEIVCLIFRKNYNMLLNLYIQMNIKEVGRRSFRGCQKWNKKVRKLCVAN